MRHLIVAHHNESLLWLPWIVRTPTPFAVHVVSNGTHRPNTGREAGAYLWWLVENYDALVPDDVYAFVQGDPFPHCPDLFDRLQADVDSWAPLSNLHVHSDADGGPHHHGLPIGEAYQELVGEPFPADGVEFWAGGQWMAPGKVLVSHQRSFFEDLAELADWTSDVEVPAGMPAIGGPWVLERLWETLLS